MSWLTAAKQRPRVRETSEAVTERMPVSRPLPIPTGGLDAISPLVAMPPESAIQMDNWFPALGYVEVRRGYAQHCDTGAGALAAVESLMAYNALTDAGDALFAAADGSIYDVSTATPSEDVTALVGNRWQHVNFSITSGNYLYIVNGQDAPRHFDGTNWATPAITGVTPENLINIAVYKERIWFCEVGSLDARYLATDAIAGAATQFTLGAVFNKGGYLMAIGTWTMDGGDGPDDRIAFISSKGEVAVYSGTNPASDFAIQGVYQIGAPIGRRCAVKVGGDLAIICKDGIIPLSKAMITERASVLSIALTANIQPLINSAVRSYGENFGWQLISYPLGTRAIMNIPTLENESSYQFVINTISGAWCRFLGQDANCWELYKDRIFFGSNDGVVYESDVGGTDDGEPIVATLRGAFTDCGSNMVKHFQMLRPFIKADAGDIVAPDIAINVDFDETAAFNASEGVSPFVAQWDEALWDVDVWPAEDRIVKDWQGIEANTGNFVSIGMQVSQSSESGEAFILQLLAFQIVYTEGGIL